MLYPNGDALPSKQTGNRLLAIRKTPHHSIVAAGRTAASAGHGITRRNDALPCKLNAALQTQRLPEIFQVALCGYAMVPEKGIEPPTFALRVRCSTD